MKAFKGDLISIPALIDPHVHFRVPGGEHKENWETGSLAAIRGGVTTVLDMPNNAPPCTTADRFKAKKQQIEAQLALADIPLRYGLYLGADKEYLEVIPSLKNECVALKIFMGCSTGGLVIDSDELLEKAFEKAKEADLLVAVHAEDEAILHQMRALHPLVPNPAFHSFIRPREAAICATEKAIRLAKQYGVSLYILHLSTKEELELVRQAKKEKLPVFAEATTHHLFLNTDAYKEWGCFVQMNPPLREIADQEALWEAIADGTLDTIGTDHAPHTLQEKRLPYGQAPSGIPGVETLLPLLLDAVNKGWLTLDKLVALTRTNSEKIFKLPPNKDRVYIDLSLEKTVTDEALHSKSKWTPYRGMKLKGWPIFTCLKGRVFEASGFSPERFEEKLQLVEHLRAYEERGFVSVG